MIHGGGHVLSTRKDIGDDQTQILLKASFLPVSVDYRLCPEITVSEGPMRDVCDAFYWARKTLDFSLMYRFDSVRTYQYASMGDRILRGLDDPVTWISDDTHCRQYLIPKPPKQLQANMPGKTSASGGFLSCNKFNAGNCKG